MRYSLPFLGLLWASGSSTSPHPLHLATEYKSIWSSAIYSRPTIVKEISVIWEAHYSKVAGHFSVENTVVVLQKYFYWPMLKQNINRYIRSCTAACAITN